MTTLVLDNGKISEIAKRIAQARAVYGIDSAYVIGLFTSIDWIVEGVQNSEETGRFLRHSVREFERLQKLKPVSTNIPTTTAQEQAPAAAQSSLAEDTWMKGAVKWFNNDKGYGFISTNNSVDVFVHWRDISSWDRSLSQGDMVEFMVTKTAKGFQAINVMKVDEATVEKVQETAAARPVADEQVRGSDCLNEDGSDGGDQAQNSALGDMGVDSVEGG